jgi:hypothetical protein
MAFILLNRLLTKPSHLVHSLPVSRRSSSRIRVLFFAARLAFTEQCEHFVGAGLRFRGWIRGGEGLEPAAAGFKSLPEAEEESGFYPVVEGVGVAEAEEVLDLVFRGDVHG